MRLCKTGRSRWEMKAGRYASAGVTWVDITWVGIGWVDITTLSSCACQSWSGKSAAFVQREATAIAMAKAWC